MSRVRYRVVVSLRRGDSPSYSFDWTRDPVRPGKVESVIADAVSATAKNMSRGWVYPTDISDYIGGAVIRSGPIRASVRRVRA